MHQELQLLARLDSPVRHPLTPRLQGGHCFWVQTRLQPSATPHPLSLEPTGAIGGRDPLQGHHELRPLAALDSPFPVFVSPLHWGLPSPGDTP